MLGQLNLPLQSQFLLSAAAAFDMKRMYPILIPGINDNHVELLNIQRKTRGWKGFIAPLQTVPRLV